MFLFNGVLLCGRYFREKVMFPFNELRGKCTKHEIVCVFYATGFVIFFTGKANAIPILFCTVAEIIFPSTTLFK